MPAKKGFAGFLVIIVSLFIVSTLSFFSFKAFFSQSQSNQRNLSEIQLNPIHGWQAYQNKKAGFTISYPKDWFVINFEDLSADFTQNDPSKNEASPSAVTVRFSTSSSPMDLSNFKKIKNLKNGQKIYEPLDVVSQLTKDRNLDFGNFDGVSYKIDRKFSAPQGPRREFIQVYEINKDGVVLKFSNSSPTLKAQQEVNDVVISQMISSLKFE